MRNRTWGSYVFDALPFAHYRIYEATKEADYLTYGLSAAGTILHPARTIYKHLHPWHFLSPVLHLCGFCLGPPRSAPAMPGSPCLYVCHWNNLEECLWRVIAGAGFCCWSAAVCMIVWVDKPPLATLAGRKHWSLTGAATNTVLGHRRRDLCDTSVCSGARGAVFLFFVLQYLDNCECIDFISPACCAFLVYVSPFKVLGGRKLTQWRLVLVLTFLSRLFSPSLSPGGTRCRARRKDRQEVTSVMSAKAKVCQEHTLMPEEIPETLLFLHIFLPSFYHFSYLPSICMKSPSLQITASLLIFHFHCTGLYKPGGELCVSLNC